MKIAVLGGGISGLSTAFLLQERLKNDEIKAQIHVFESDNRLGGKIKSFKTEEGYLCEYGTNGFLNSKPYTIDLCKDLGIYENILSSNDESRERFVYSKGKLHKLPKSAPQFLSCSLLSPLAKARVAWEPFVKKYHFENDESLKEFAVRRLGKELYEKLIDPMVSGVFAGNPETMSLKSSFPRIYELEYEYGSLIKAMMKLASKKAKERKKEGLDKEMQSSPSGPGGRLVSFKGGLEELIQALENKLEIKPKLGARAMKITSKQQTESSNYTITFQDGGSFEADIIISAIPGYAAFDALKYLDESFEDFTKIPYASLSIVGMGFDKKSFPHPLNGFGYLIPSKEKMKMLGTLWTSSIFKHRVKAEKVYIRNMLGGARANELALKPDDELIQISLEALEKTMGLKACKPEFVKIFKHEKAIPQYLVGHEVLVDNLETVASRNHGIFLTGNVLRGVGINDCVKSSQEIVEKVVNFIKS
ncbi:MAG: protoporphyrinogen oxidase [Pseudomonadota bacterium]